MLRTWTQNVGTFVGTTIFTSDGHFWSVFFMRIGSCIIRISLILDYKLLSLDSAVSGSSDSIPGKTFLSKESFLMELLSTANPTSLLAQLPKTFAITVVALLSIFSFSGFLCIVRFNK